jgi:hypothetical protein
MGDGLLGLYPISLVTGSLKSRSDESNPQIISPETRIPYSPECVEGEFCELRLAAILGSLPTRCGIGPGIWRKARECPDFRTQWGTPPEGPPFPSMVVSKHIPSAKKTPLCGICKG